MYKPNHKEMQQMLTYGIMFMGKHLEKMAGLGSNSEVTPLGQVSQIRTMELASSHMEVRLLTSDHP